MTGEVDTCDREVTEGDLLYGVPAIANFLGIGVRHARHLCEMDRVPTFKLGSMICSRKSALSRWLDEQLRASSRS